jgi:microsomal dipeptidase-like Zn-dependent dipeptidase
LIAGTGAGTVDVAAVSTGVASVLVDLHAHFPMHLLPDSRQKTHERVRAWSRRRWQARIVEIISGLANYQGPADTPSVTEALMRDGDVGVVLSVLYAPFDEMDLEQPYAAPPRGRYFADILAELQTVEEYATDHGDEIAIAHSPSELDVLVQSGRRVLVHCIEGGFQLGADEQTVGEHVRTLAEHGVAYVTVAHLFWRSVATNAPALPFLPDWLYHLVFPQPSQGLSPLGHAAVEAMIDNGILVDITHMSSRAANDTLTLFDRRDPDRRIPVIATHMACRFGGLEYCLPDDTIRRVSERGGVLGCILCEHFITDGLRERADSFDDSVGLLCRHIDRIRELTGSFDNIGIGSDLDGYIKPALPGLEHMGHMRALQQSLRERYGSQHAEKICSANALRVLHSAWGTAPPTV